MDYPKNLFRIAEESERAPGLPFPPPRSMINYFNEIHSRTKFIPVLSINYDSIPMCIESPKMFWVDLEGPAPSDLSVGSPARLHITPNRGIRTSLNQSDIRNSVFEVTDIVGSRVILSPYRGSAWLPTVHAGCDNPFGWGYNMQIANVSTNPNRIKYGFGVPVSFLEYYPYNLYRREMWKTSLEKDHNYSEMYM